MSLELMRANLPRSVTKGPDLRKLPAGLGYQEIEIAKLQTANITYFVFTLPFLIEFSALLYFLQKVYCFKIAISVLLLKALASNAF
jgi:hypothetical protein